MIVVSGHGLVHGPLTRRRSPSRRTAVTDFSGLPDVAALAQTGCRGNRRRGGEMAQVGGENLMVAKPPAQGAPAAAAPVWNDCIARIARDNDEAAFEAVFRHFAPRLKSYFMRLGADSSQAEEIAQEALVLVWRNAARFDPAKANVATWIFTIARNLSIDRFRKARRPAFDPSDPAFEPDPDPSPQLAMEQAEVDAKIRSLVEGLPDNERRVLMMSFFEDRSHSEIADELGLPLGTVKSRIRLAFGRFRAALGNWRG